MRYATWGVLLLLVLGCDASAPTRDQSETRTARAVSAPDTLTARASLTECNDPACEPPPPRPWSWSVIVGRGTDAAARDSSAEVLSFPSRTRVRIRASGSIARSYNPAIATTFPQYTGYFPPIDADGEWLGSDKSAFLFTNFTGTGVLGLTLLRTPTWGSGNSQHDATAAEYEVSGVVRGTGRIVRRGFLQPMNPGPPACNGVTGIPCVLAAGGQHTVVVEIIAQQLSLTASLDSITVGDSVTFTATATSALAVLEWKWQPSLSAATHTPVSLCTAGQSTCTIPVFEPGTMYVLATVGTGSSATREVAWDSVAAADPVYPPVTCPTGDSLLDLGASRGLLRQLAELTDSVVPKREWAGYVYRLPGGQYRFKVDLLSIVAEPCRSSYANPTAPVGWTHVLHAHSHPGAPKQKICNDTLKVETGPHGGLLSSSDWDGADPTWHSPPTVPVAVIDPQKMAIGSTGVWLSTDRLNTASGILNRKIPNKTQFDESYKEFKRQENLCVRP